MVIIPKKSVYAKALASKLFQPRTVKARKGKGSYNRKIRDV
jgi:stalled ribosome alternative rescue factor ArfA